MKFYRIFVTLYALISQWGLLEQEQIYQHTPRVFGHLLWDKIHVTLPKKARIHCNTISYVTDKYMNVQNLS